MGPIPAKYFWPGLCVALLLMSIGVGVTTVVMSRSDGGAQVLDKTNPAAAERQVEKAKESATDRR